MDPNGYKTPAVRTIRPATAPPAARTRRRPMQQGLRSHRPRYGAQRNVRLLLIALLVLSAYWLTASAPLYDVPDVQSRFADWAQASNDSLVQVLPGAESMSATVQDVYQPTQDDHAALPQPEVTVSEAPVIAPTDAPVQNKFPVYAPGELDYSSDTVDLKVTQHKQDDFTYYVADIQIKDASQFSYAFSHDAYGRGNESVSDIADRNGALLAFNGDFCGSNKVGIVIRGGKLYRKQNSARHLLIVEADGTMRALTDRSGKQGQVANKLVDEGVLHTFEFGPLLVKDGEAVRMSENFFIRTGRGYVEPRTAIGQLGPLHYLVIVVDGRTPGYSEGCDLPTLQQLFIDRGCDFAFNLDGGGSTTLYLDGRVINHPSSGDERSVSDIVQFTN